MDIQRAPGTAMCIPSRNRTVDRSHPTSRSSSYTSSSSSRIREPMAIPGVRFDDAPPPPLPPPRYNEELDRGIDVAWHWGNSQYSPKGLQSQLAPIKSDSSLHGASWHSQQTRTRIDRSPDDEDTEMRDPDDDEISFERYGSTVSTIRSPSQNHIRQGSSIPGLNRKPPTPPISNHRLHGEQPLAQQNFNRSSQAYDKRVLSKIGKPNSPPRHYHSESTESATYSLKLSLQTKESKSQRLAVTEVPSASLDPVSRWITSPLSAGISPGSRPGWRDYNMDHRSPSIDSAATSLVLDPELFVQSRNNGRVSTSGSAPINNDPEYQTRPSHRGSHDRTLYVEADSEVTGEDTTAFRNLNLSDPSLRTSDQHPSKQGMKRRAMSPPIDLAQDEKPAVASYPRTNSSYLASARSPNSAPNSASTTASRYSSHYGSISSTASSIRQDSYASSLALSIAGSSMTSISSFDRNSPSDRPHAHQFITSAPQTSSPASASTPLRKHHLQLPETKSVPSKMSIETAINDVRPTPPTRIGNYYICDCCPKKPKKFNREDELRVHQMEKQYSCQYCNNRFKNKNEAERHQNSLHLRRYSWSCAAIPSYQAAFHSSASTPTQGSNGSPTDACGFCGEEFPNYPQPNMERRIDHLTNVHKFGECNQTKKFFRADHFRQHLKHSHGGQSGKWTNLLETVCLREEGPSDITSVSPTGSDSSPGRGPSSLPVPGDTPMGGANVDEARESP